MEYDPLVIGAGTRLQSGIPKRPRPASAEGVGGLLMRGVVIATYVIDDPNHPFAEAQDKNPVAVYCDVLTYGRMVQRIPNALVAQDRSGMHSSRIWKPRAARLDVTGGALDLDKASNPANLDGDHVLLGFLDDNLNQPVVLRSLPHPSADQGNAEKDVGQRTRLKLVDGDPDLFRHKGVFYGITTEGNFLVDTTGAYGADGYLPDGSEPESAGDGAAGNYWLNLPQGSTLTIQVADGATLNVADKDGNATMTLGDGAQPVALHGPLKALWDQLVAKINAADAHTHVTPAGGSGPPTPPIVAPQWDPTIESQALKVPK